MQPLPARFSRRQLLGCTVSLLALVCLAAACDRHSAAEVPESYGHGSSHQDSYTDHQIDSRHDSRSFSDTQGLNVSKTGQSGAGAEPTASPAATVSGHFFPSGQ